MTDGRVLVRLLGPVEAARDGAVLTLGGHRQRALLALLAVAGGRAVTAESLADELWHGSPPGAYRTTLRSYVSRLRQVLGESLLESAHDSTYRLRVSPGTVDADVFEGLAREGDHALASGSPARARDLYAEALDLWRGPALAQVAEEGRLRAEAERLEDLRLHVIEQRIDADIALGRPGQVVEEIESLVRSHPFRERLWRQLMLALYHSERQADALEAYQRARRSLVEELGVEPSPRLRELEEAILRHEVGTVDPRTPRHNLPAAVTSFVGRRTQLAEVAALLRRSRWVTVTGVGGVGKTRLALESARGAIAAFPGGVFFCDLAAVADREHVSVAVASAVGVREAGDDPVTATAGAIGAVETLLVLDNAEHVRSACARLVARLLGACAGLRVLVTSRAPLGAIGEVDFPLPPLELPTGAADSGKGSAESVELFFDRARSAHPRVRADQAAHEAAARICTELDGIPLAIELAAARAKMLSLDEIAENLTDRFRFLVSWRRLTPGRHQTLREAMDWSFTLLSEEERRAFARLSVFPAGFTVTSAAGLCWDGDRSAALAFVERLGDASLIMADMRSTATRYRMLETVRRYAEERLEEYGETAAMQQAHAREVLAFAEQTYDEQFDHMDRFAEDIGRRQADLRAALAWSSAHDPETMARLVKRAWQFWWVRGHLAEGRSWIRSALRFAEQVGPALTAEMLEGAAGLAWAQGDMDEADERAAASLALYEQVEDPRGVGAALIILGHVALGHREDFAAAERYFDQARRVQEDNGLWAGATIATHNLGSVAFAAGDLARAEQRYLEARSQYEAADDTYGVAISDLYLGLAAAEDGRADEAGRILGRALPVFREMKFLQYAAQCLDGAAVVARACGDAAEAVRLLAAAESLREQTGQSPSVAHRLRDRELRHARAAIGEKSFAATWREGQQLGQDEALDRAQAVLGG